MPQPLRIDIFSLFPGMFAGPFSESIIKRAIAADRAVLTIHDIRTFARDKHHTADDTLDANIAGTPGGG